MKDHTIESKGSDGKSKPLKFDDDGNLIIQYTKHEKEDTTEIDKPINRRTRYYEDHNLNQYRYTTHRQEDGKFAVIFRKFYKKNGYGNYKVTKQRSFSKKKTAIAYCLKAYLKARTRQEEVLKRRAVKKKARLDLKPKGLEKSRIEANEKLVHFRKLSINVDKQRKEAEKKYKKQLRSLATRQKTYRKKAKYYQKRTAQLGQVDTKTKNSEVRS